ncbi:MAG TPA: hypothetical protein PK987_08265 [Ferruginibacter sp.]|nr:hypothetical protein [Ferruginibacter sp.]
MKKTLNLSTRLLVMSFIGAMVLTSCKKDESLSPTTENDPVEVAATQNITAQDAESEAQFDDVFNITASMNSSVAGEDLGVGANVSGLFDLGSTTANTRGRCFTVTVVPNIPHVFPKTVTIDFGTGCLGRDGKFRKGKIISIFTNPMVVPGAKVSTTFVGYFVDSFHIEGTHISENTSTTNMQGWKNVVIDGKITNTNTGRWHMWNSTRNILQVAGNGTAHFPLDDIYKVTGNANGSNAAGNSWTSLILDPLIKKFVCPWIVKGTVKLVRNGREALLDYGNGDCDNKAILYINGVPHIITL